MTDQIPNHSINYYAPLAIGGTCSIGQVMIPNADDRSYYVVATEDNRGSRGAEGVAISAWGGASGTRGQVRLKQDGILPNSISGLGSGAKALVRTSATGTMERVSSYTPGDDIIGFAEADGRVHLHFGLPWGLIAGVAAGAPTYEISAQGQYDDLDATVDGLSAAVIVYNSGSDTESFITGIEPGISDETSSRTIAVINRSAGTLSLTINDTDSAAANRIANFDVPGSGKISIRSGGGVVMSYDPVSATQRWIVVGRIYSGLADLLPSLTGQAGKALVVNELETAITFGDAGEGFTRPRGWYDVVDYGAVGDGSTDDIDAFEAALADMGSNVQAAGAGYKTLYISPGTYRLSRHLVIDRAVHILGASNPYDLGSASILKFDAYQGIRIYGRGSSPTGGDGSNAKVSQIRLVGDHNDPHLHDAWAAGTSFALGDKVIPLGTRAAHPAYAGNSGFNLSYYYECIKAGVSDSTEPDWGSKQVLNYSETWQAATAYFNGQVVRPTSSTRQDYAFIATTPALYAGSATSGGSEPAAFNTANYGDSVVDSGVTWFCFNPSASIHTDNTVKWAVRTGAGIFANCLAHVDDCVPEKFQGPGVHWQGDLQNLPLTGCSGSTAHRVHVGRCGTGFLMIGPDANNICLTSCNVTLAAQSDKEVGYHDASYLGGHLYNCHMDETPGPCLLVTSSVNVGTISGFYCEQGAEDAQLFGQSNVTGGNFAGLYTAASTFTGWLRHTDWRNVNFRDPTYLVSDGVEGTLAFSKAILGEWSAEGWDYVGQAHRFYPTPQAWMRTWAGSTGVASDGWTISKANEGANHKWYPRGFLLGGTEGTPEDRRFTQPYELKGDAFFRQGEKKVGDVVVNNKLAVTNKAFGQIVAAAGYDGETWSAGDPVQYGQWDRGLPANGNPSAMRVPTVRNGYVYRCTKIGTTDSVEPTWPTVVGTEARTWPDDLLCRVIVGDFIRPSTPNSHIYEVTAIDGYDSFLVGGVSEPDWSTAVVNNVSTITSSGGLVHYICRADDTSTWVEDNTTIWTCIGVEATYEGFGRMHSQRDNSSGGTLTDVSTFDANGVEAQALLFTNTSNVSAGSFTGGRKGRSIFIRYTGEGTFTIPHNSGGTSTNRVMCPGNVDFVMTSADSGVELFYDLTSLRWCVQQNSKRSLGIAGASTTILGSDLGVNLSGDVSVNMATGKSILVDINGSQPFWAAETFFGVGQPLGGINGDVQQPFRWKHEVIIYASANYTLSDAEAACPLIFATGTTAGARDLVAPDKALSFFMVVNQTADTLTVKKSGGTGATVEAGKTRFFIHSGGDYIKMDFT